MNERDERPALTLGERLFGALATLLTLGALVLGALALSRHEQRLAFEEHAASVTRDIAVVVGELETLMNALVGMHQRESGLDGEDGLIASFERLREQIPYVRSVGRYAKIETDERRRFESDGQDSGLYDFRITTIDADGHARTRESARRYYPISMLEPMVPARLRLLGADLGSVAGLARALDRVATNDTPLVTTLPAGWPTGNELLVFRAAYRGKHPPENAAERLQQFDGGYWIAVDLDAILGAASGPIERFDLTLHIEGPRGVRPLLEREASEGFGTHLRALHPRLRSGYRWRLGDGALTLSLAADTALSTRLLVTLLLLAGLLLGAVGAGALSVRSSRLRAREGYRARMALDAEREKADRTLNAIDDAVLTLDEQLRVLHLNPAAARLVGRERGELRCVFLPDVLGFRHAEDERRFDLEAALASLERGGPREFDLVRERGVRGSRSIESPAEEIVLHLTLTRTERSESLPGGYILVLRDISAERRLTRRLEYQVNHDALTGCTNRRYFERRLEELLESIASDDRRHAVCYIDLDQFKIVNDTCGHTAGDRLLQDLTVNLLALCRKGDVLSRLGGDEFGLIIVDADEKEARGVAERVHAFFQSYVFRHGERAFAVRASIGLVPLDATGGSVGDVLAAADLACYAAKDAGRNTLYVYAADDETLAQRSSELNRLPELRRALEHDRFELHVQAVARIDESRAAIESGGAEIEHFEFLLRLRGEDGRPVTPFRIIEAAERYGLMREIDRWVISHALGKIAALRGGPGSDCSFSINLSGQSAADPTLIDFIEQEYARLDIDPTRIWFELTETAAISQFSIAVELAERIRALGSKVALDDFGSGLSSFGYLKNIPVDVLKIDGQFVREIVADPIDRSIVRAIGEVGRSMGLVTVAEFVEDEATVTELVRIGIDYAQGYHVGRPRPLDEALSELGAPASRAA